MKLWSSRSGFKISELTLIALSATKDKVFLHSWPPESFACACTRACDPKVPSRALSMQKIKYLFMYCLWATSWWEVLPPVTTLRYRMWLMSSSCSKLNQNVRIAVPSIRKSLHGGFSPFCIQPMTLATMGSSLCHARSCSLDQGWTHLPKDVFASKFITRTWWPGQPMSSTLSLDSCLSQWRHSWHGLLDSHQHFCVAPQDDTESQSYTHWGLATIAKAVLLGFWNSATIGNHGMYELWSGDHTSNGGNASQQ